MNELTSKTCTACKGGVVPFTKGEIMLRMDSIPGWHLAETVLGNEGFGSQGRTLYIHKLERKFQFKTFAGALVFVRQVSELAEEQKHHPDIAFGWGYANIFFQTHAINGLHENDFIMAAKVTALAEEKWSPRVDPHSVITVMSKKIPAEPKPAEDVCKGTGGAHEWQDATKNTIVACTACGKIK